MYFRIKCNQREHLGSSTARGLRGVCTARYKSQTWQAVGHACSGERQWRAQHPPPPLQRTQHLWAAQSVPYSYSSDLSFGYPWSTNEMSSSKTMWSGGKLGWMRLPSQYTCRHTRIFSFCFFFNSCQWSKSCLLEEQAARLSCRFARLFPSCTTAFILITLYSDFLYWNWFSIAKKEVAEAGQGLVPITVIFWPLTKVLDTKKKVKSCDFLTTKSSRQRYTE